MRYRYRHLLTGIDPRLVVDSSPDLVRFRSRLAEQLPGTPEQRRKKAEDFTDRLAVAVFDDLGRSYEAEFNPRIDRIMDLREQIQGKYKQIQDLDPTKPIPPDLTPEGMNQLFSSLEKELRALERVAGPTNHLNRYWRDVPSDNVGKLLDDIQREIDPKYTFETEPDAPETKPTLDLDDPLNLPDDTHLSDVRDNYHYDEYETSDGGRIKEAEGYLGVPDEVQTHRDKNAQDRVAGGTLDEAGHLIGNQFGPHGDERNLSRQNAAVNGASYKQLEMDWRELLMDGEKVHVLVQDHFRPGADRPYKRTVDWRVEYRNGRVTTDHRVWANPEWHGG